MKTKKTTDNQKMVPKTIVLTERQIKEIERYVSQLKANAPSMPWNFSSVLRIIIECGKDEATRKMRGTFKQNS